MINHTPVPPPELRAAFLSARSRAARAELAFQLSFEDVRHLFARQDGLCAISRLPFSRMRIETAFVKHPFAPSLDRIDCAGGYTKDNVRLVLVAVNFGLGQWGEAVFRMIAAATVRSQPSNVVLSDPAERAGAATDGFPLLPAEEPMWPRRRLAALKRARTLGPEGLRMAAERAAQTRRAAIDRGRGSCRRQPRPG